MICVTWVAGSPGCVRICGLLVSGGDGLSEMMWFIGQVVWVGDVCGWACVVRCAGSPGYACICGLLVSGVMRVVGDSAVLWEVV